MLSIAATMLVGTMSSGAVFATPMGSMGSSSFEIDFNSTNSRTMFIQICLHYKRMSAQMKHPFPYNITKMLNICDRSSKDWFGKFYYEQWQRSWEKKTFEKVLKYVNPTLLFVTLVTILKSEIVLFRLDRHYKQAIWKILFWHNTLTLKEYTIFYLPTFAAKNLDAYNLEHSIYGCKMLTFSRNVVANAPVWFLILFIVDQLMSMAARRRTTLTPFSVCCIMLGLIGALVVFNVHTLWLATYYPSDAVRGGAGGRCIFNIGPVQSVVFNQIYPILLVVLHDILPIALISLSLCAFLVLLCLKRQCNPDIATASFLGLSYVLFATPENIEWLVRHVTVEKENKTLEEFKKNYAINVLAHMWSFFRYFFFVPILLICNPDYRRMTSKIFLRRCYSQEDAVDGEETEREEEARASEHAAACSSGAVPTSDATSPMLPSHHDNGCKRIDSFDSLNLVCGCVHRARCSSSVVCICECLPVYRQPKMEDSKPSDDRQSSHADRDKESRSEEKASRLNMKGGCWPQGKLSSRYIDHGAFPLVCHCDWLRNIVQKRRCRRLAGSIGSITDEENRKEGPITTNGTTVPPIVEIEDREAMADTSAINNYVIIVSQCGAGEENGEAHVTSV